LWIRVIMSLFSFLFGLFPFAELIIDILRRNKIGARLNVA
jgi:hypothetical protein